MRSSITTPPTAGRTIRTERLILRPPDAADALAIARGAGDLDVARMATLIPHPYPPELADGWIVFAGVRIRRGLEHLFVIERPGAGAVGAISLFKRGAAPDWEVGYWIAKPHWGHGYASEALAAVLAWARETLRAARVMAGHFEDNPASRRVLEKAGFAPTGKACPEYSLARGARVVCVGMAITLDAPEAADRAAHGAAARAEDVA